MKFSTALIPTTITPTTLAQTERQYLGATVRLYKALGGGWLPAPRP